jgi:hypothetical protein
MDYKIPAHAYIKKVIKEGCNPLLPNYVGHIGPKPVYEANKLLESMDGILVRKEVYGKLQPNNGESVRDTPRTGALLQKIGGESYKTLVPVGYVPGIPYKIWNSRPQNPKDMDYSLVYIDIYTSVFVPFTATAVCAGKNPIDSLYYRDIPYNKKKLDNLVKELTK